MPVTIEDFPHHGEQLETDEKQADWTMVLLAVFVVGAVFLFLLAYLG